MFEDFYLPSLNQCTLIKQKKTAGNPSRDGYRRNDYTQKLSCITEP